MGRGGEGENKIDICSECMVVLFFFLSLGSEADGREVPIRVLDGLCNGWTRIWDLGKMQACKLEMNLPSRIAGILGKVCPIT